jgi:ubiquinone/menaquinone biosynthesis C-methylase UbiE
MDNGIGGKIGRGYKSNADRYDDYILSRKLWSKIIVKIIWGIRDQEYSDKLIALIPDGFNGKLLDVPAGTAVFTCEKYRRMKDAEIVCLDYSREMLDHGVEKFKKLDIKNVQCLEGDAGSLPFADNHFDMVLSMNGFHAFPDKERAFDEICRVLKPGGIFTGCFYIRGEKRRTDFFIKNIFVRSGTFTPPFMNKGEVEKKLNERYHTIKLWNTGSIVCFQCGKK